MHTPNITPGKYRDSYASMRTNPAPTTLLKIARACIEARLQPADAEIGYGEWEILKHNF
ncbi:MAG: hypothetical protein R2744_02615 [Bacteroidales bacterium]